MKKIFILISIILCTALSGCTNKSVDNTLNILLKGEKPLYFDDVVNEAHHRLEKDGMDFKLNFEFVDEAYNDTLYVRLLAGKDYDIVYDSIGGNYKTFSKMEMYTPLDEYIENYPNIKELTDKRMWDVQKARLGHIYGIPRCKSYSEAILNCILYRSDWANEWGIDKIDSYDELEVYLGKCLEEKRDVIPLVTKEASGFVTTFEEDYVSLWNDGIIKTEDEGLDFYAVLDDSRSEVCDIVFFNEPAENFNVMPVGYENGKNTIRDNYRTFEKWLKYVDSDKERKDDTAKKFKEGRAGAYVTSYSNYESVQKEIKETDSEARVGVFFVGDYKLDTDGKLYTELTADHYTCIPINSNKKEMAVGFLNWLAKKENSDLFSYGIEGVHWQDLGNSEYKKLKAYDFNANTLTASPANQRFLYGSDEVYKAVAKRSMDLSNFIINPLSGFKLNTEGVAGAMAEVGKIFDDKRLLDFMNGRIKNVDKEAERDYAKMKNPLEKIEKELIKQMNSFLETGKNKE